MTGVIPQEAAQVRAAYRAGELTPVDVLDATLAHIDRVDPVINAVAHLDEVGARASAEASAARWAAGCPLGDLDGIPVTIKDSINAIGMPWRHGSKAHATVPDAMVDAPPAARLKEAGAVIVGKTTMPDFGMMAAGVSSLYGIVRNPWNPARNTGGSSAGAGAALAAGIGYAAVGTDIAGSVRLPAAHCGLVALKPTQGRIPHAPASTMRSAGPMARTVDEVVDLYRVISRPDPRDTWSLPPEADDTLDVELSPAGLRIGVLTDMGHGHPLDERVLSVVGDAAAALQDGGAAVAAVPPPFAVDPYPALDRVFQVRARAEWETLPEECRHLVLPAVADWAAAAADRSAVQYAADLARVDASQARLQSALADYDFVLAPVIPTPGFAADEVGLYPDRPLAHCTYTAWFNQTGQPASTLCFGFVDECPVAVQIVGARFDDQRLLRLTRWLERHRPFPMSWPRHVVAVPTGGSR
ncbi:amidase [Rhodococcus ruber]|uniref:amidase n=1 Tax=Rhodococcus ruber TaxID=1830 RepID=UPI0007CD664E|nr:amidase [Rhodococcus ruber]AWH01478.1 amidase [Rhodococcus ruber]QRE79101.1 amidase [Rhodococcus ruber]